MFKQKKQDHLQFAHDVNCGIRFKIDIIDMKQSGKIIILLRITNSIQDITITMKQKQDNYFAHGSIQDEPLT